MWAMMQKFRMRAGSVLAGVVTVPPSSHAAVPGNAIAHERRLAHSEPMPLPGSPRLPYARLPAGLRAEIEGALGSPVVGVHGCSGGFSPGTAAVLTCGNGDRAFVKAVGTPLNPDTPALHRSEALIAAALPASLPTPRFRWSTEWVDGDDVWVALLFDAVEGTAPTLPWSADAAARAVTALVDLARAGTPCPVPDLPTVADRVAADLTGWARLVADPPADLDPWARRKLDWLTEIPDRLAASGGLDGDTLAHLDLRADNLLIDAAGNTVVVDWPWAARGSAWIDTALFVLDPAVHGGLDPEQLLRQSPLLADARPADVTDLLLGLAGMWGVAMRRPPSPGLPTVRAFQRRFHEAALAWGRRRVGAAELSRR
jgi:hypothetical protein